MKNDIEMDRLYRCHVNTNRKNQRAYFWQRKFFQALWVLPVHYVEGQQNRLSCNTRCQEHMSVESIRRMGDKMFMEN